MDQKEFERLAGLYKTSKNKIKELTESKLEIEEQLKNYMEEKELNKVQFSNCSISFNKFEKATPVSNSLTLETCYNKLLENKKTIDIADEILDSVREELDKNKKISIIRTLRLKED